MARRRKRAYGDGSVYYCRRTGRWVAAVMVQGKRVAASADTEERAERLRATIAAGRIPPAQQTLAAYLKEWLVELERTGAVRPNTLRLYRQACEAHIIPGLGRLRMERITPRDVQAFVGGLAGVLAPSTARLTRTILSVALRRAVRLEIVERNVVALTDPPPDGERSRRAMSEGEQAAFLRAIAGHRLAPLYLLGMTTGLRIGEALGLTWSEVDLERRRLAVVRQMQLGELAPVKTRSSVRVVSFPEVAARALGAWRTAQKAERLAAKRWHDTGLVFTAEDGSALPASRVRESLSALCERAGIGHFTFHELRHTAASALLNDGESLKTVSSLLGHRTVGITADLYGHTDEAAKDRAAARFDRLLNKTAE